MISFSPNIFKFNELALSFGHLEAWGNLPHLTFLLSGEVVRIKKKSSLRKVKIKDS